MGDRASIGFASTNSAYDHAVLFIEQAGLDGRSRFDIMIVGDPPSACPAPPTGTFGFLASFGGFQIVDTP